MPEPTTLDEWLVFISSVHPQDMELGLERVAGVAATLGVSQPAPHIVTIAGTNGKGSTTALLEALLRACGNAVGATFSPHLNRFNERIRLNGEEASDEQICQAFSAVNEARGETPLTYFEYGALAALYLFRQAQVDVALLEIGLGGRLDAFNLVDADVAVVTSIGLDHQDYLGDDLEAIGREKAGIFRASRPVVLGNVTESVRQVAGDLGCSRHQLGADFSVERSSDRWRYTHKGLNLSLEHLTYGAFAPDNCALAVTAACLVLARQQRPVAAETLARALTQAHLAGRMEVREYRQRPVLLDVAHNPAAAAFLAGELEQRWPGRRYVAIYGALEDKDAKGVMQALAPLVRHWLLVPTFGWRGQSAASLANKLGASSRAETCLSMAEAFDRAGSLTESGNGILAFGSFSAVEQARELLINPRQQTDEA
jgi:dihydrofolate synthase/folylpolyglutamate synthase